MLNVFVLKKYTAMLFVGFFSTIGFAIGVMFYTFLIGIATFLTCMLVSILAGNLLLKNPFSSLLEGKGLLALNVDSTGVITPFIFTFKDTEIKANFKGKLVSDQFDRKAVLQMSAPKTVQKVMEEKDGKLVITIDKNIYNEARFQLYQYPTLLYNAQIGSIVTKDFISEKEKDAMAEHTILYLNRKVQDLTTAVLNFGRYVVDSLKPETSIWQNKWIWIIIALAVGAVVIMFAPAVIDAISGTVGTASNAIPSVPDPTSTISPRG